MQVKDDHAVRMDVGLFNRVEVDNLLTVGAEEPSGIKTRFDHVQRAADQRTAPADVDARVIAVRLEQRDLRRVHDPASVTIAKKESGSPRLSRGDTLQRVRQALRRNRFEQVVECVHFEGLNSVPLVGSGEDHLRNICAKSLEQIEPVAARHLDIEEHQVGRVVEECERFLDVSRLTNNLDFCMRLQQPPQLDPGERLVVDNDGFQRHADTGIRTLATTLPWRSTSDMVACSP